MLAKLWKNILLAICIIAILFNLTSKLVRRYSLDSQLDSVAGGESLSEVLKDDKEKDDEEEEESTKKETTKIKEKKKNNILEDFIKYKNDNSDDEEEDN